MPRKPSPIGSATARTSLRWLEVSLQVWCRFSSGAPDSSSWPAGSSDTEAWSRVSAMTRPCSSTGCPAEAGQALEQRLDAAIAVEGGRTQVVGAEAELLVLGADLPVFARARAGAEELDQVGPSFYGNFLDVTGTGHVHLAGDNSFCKARCPARAMWPKRGMATPRCEQRREGINLTCMVGTYPQIASLAQCSGARVWNNGGPETL